MTHGLWQVELIFDELTSATGCRHIDYFIHGIRRFVCMEKQVKTLILPYILVISNFSVGSITPCAYCASIVMMQYFLFTIVQIVILINPLKYL